MGYIREYCQDCQKEHLKRTVCDEVARPVDVLVMFQGLKVKKGYRDAYMNGYKNPYGINPGGEFALAYEKGQIAWRQDTCLEGTF